ncbi:MAG: 2-C-methyl-D-erythritol 4-phosphate cytidylyltransferase [Ectothiorhodospiraceae bacterium]|nr:2-C-methyl-D-erythritol 4-phosphate cytidylyltransferase [Ectothiorhodospiraceae bacterium]
MNESDTPPIWAVVPAAGVGRRMQARVPKQYLPLLGRPVIHWSLQALLGHPGVAGCIVALGRDDPYWARYALSNEKPMLTVVGGAERFQSVLNALEALLPHAGEEAWVLVHDAVRPCLTGAELDRLIEQGMISRHGALLACPVRDTLKREGEEGCVAATANRAGLWHAMTPQLFPLLPLLRALRLALAEQTPVTDEAQAMERQGFQPLLVEGESTNLKITRPADLPLAEAILRSLGRLQEEGDADAADRAGV